VQTIICRTEHAQDEKLEAAYQKYAHRQRQKSLVLVNLFDLCIKVIIILKEGQRSLLPMRGVIWDLAMEERVNFLTKWTKLHLILHERDHHTQGRSEETAANERGIVGDEAMKERVNFLTK
jgi:hypothetical protein